MQQTTAQGGTEEIALVELQMGEHGLLRTRFVGVYILLVLLLYWE